MRTDGSWEVYPTGEFSVAGAGLYLPAPELAMDGAVWGVAEEYGDARLQRCRVLLCLSLGLSRLFSVLSFGLPLLHCKRTGLVSWVLTTLMLLGPLVGCLIGGAWLNLYLWLRMGILLLLPST